jgi:hypothetical protein
MIIMRLVDRINLYGSVMQYVNHHPGATDEDIERHTLKTIARIEKANREKEVQDSQYFKAKKGRNAFDGLEYKQRKKR